MRLAPADGVDHAGHRRHPDRLRVGEGDEQLVEVVDSPEGLGAGETLGGDDDVEEGEVRPPAGARFVVTLRLGPDEAS
ncbi:MAG: hypothetical protein L0Z49_08335 [Actinobacteria bacterium]|nr:hypothetical protein [Actinomycetota bacterium]